MNKWLSQQFGKNKLKTGRLQKKELNDDLAIPDNALQQATADPLIKTAMADSEQIVTGIHAKILAEAESEIEKIIAQAKLEAQEKISRDEVDGPNQAEDIMSAAYKKTEIIKVEAKQKALQLLIRAEEEMEKEPASLKPGDQALYTGEVVLFIPQSGGLRVLSMLNDYLQGISELKVLTTSGSYQGTTITVELDKPLRLMSILSQIPGVEVTPEPLGKDDLVAVSLYSPLGGEKKGVRRIKLSLKEA